MAENGAAATQRREEEEGSIEEVETNEHDDKSVFVNATKCSFHHTIAAKMVHSHEHANLTDTLYFQPQHEEFFPTKE